MLADEPVASLDPRNAKIVMDALQRINRHFGLTVLCNLHSLDLARGYCDRLVGMAAGRVVFDDVPAALTEDVARELYGLEADEVLGGEPSARPGRRHAAADARLRPFGPSTQPRGKSNDPTAARCSPASPPAPPLAPLPRWRRCWKANYPELVYAVVPAENASGVADRFAPFVAYLSQAARHQGDAARRQRLRRGDRGPARRQHPHRLLRSGLVLPRAG